MSDIMSHDRYQVRFLNMSTPDIFTHPYKFQQVKKTCKVLHKSLQVFLRHFKVPKMKQDILTTADNTKKVSTLKWLNQKS
jgi:hypothetical protein